MPDRSRTRPAAPSRDSPALPLPPLLLCRACRHHSRHVLFQPGAGGVEQAVRRQAEAAAAHAGSQGGVSWVGRRVRVGKLGRRLSRYQIWASTLELAVAAGPLPLFDVYRHRPGCITRLFADALVLQYLLFTSAATVNKQAKSRQDARRQQGAVAGRRPPVVSWPAMDASRRSLSAPSAPAGEAAAPAA